MTEPHVLGVLPARGGSKGIPRKNVRILCGRPLLGWAAEAISKAPSISRAICSTDDKEIAEVAIASGLEVPFLRPVRLAGDTTLVADVLIHALDQVDDTKNPYTHIALVQATSPTVTVDDVEAAIEIIRRDSADTVISGFKASMHHPAIMFTLDSHDFVSWFLPRGAHSVRRQDFPEVFIRSGLIYVVSVDVLRRRGQIYGDKVRSIIIEEDRAITIDAERDFNLASQIMGKCL